MDVTNEYARDAVPEGQGGHPSQAEGEDPSRAGQHPDPWLDGHPSQAEGEDTEDESDG